MERIYKLSAIKLVKKLPIQPSFRLVSDTYQIFGNPGKAYKYLIKEKLIRVKNKSDEDRLKQLLICVEKWLDEHAPNELKYELTSKAKLDKKQKENVKELIKLLKSKKLTKSQLEIEIFKLAKDNGIKDFFESIYLALFNKKRGPKLAEFIYARGQSKIIKVLKQIT